ncbi:haloacid dehalogenase-like hydrolase [Acidaminobacterium chupaoyuni]
MDIICYDFDKTVYHGDSSTHFTLWCLRHYPKTWLHLPAMAGWSLLYACKIVKKTLFKSHLFGYLKFLSDPQKSVDLFWQSHEQNLKAWYLAKDHSRDVIISASPTFLLEGVCRRLGVLSLLATPMDPRTGRIHGENCWGEEKVCRLNGWNPDSHLLEFYSDSYSDTPLARLADKAFLVEGDLLKPWEKF